MNSWRHTVEETPEAMQQEKFLKNTPEETHEGMVLKEHSSIETLQN